MCVASPSAWTTRGRAFDNFFIERPWRSLTYEWLYFHSFADVFSMSASQPEYINSINKRRQHKVFSYRTPDKCTYSAPCGAPSM